MKKLKGVLTLKEFLIQGKCTQEFKCKHHLQINNFKTKNNKTSETIIRKCVHCGMCNATCPTYQVNGEELEGPREEYILSKIC